MSLYIKSLYNISSQLYINLEVLRKFRGYNQVYLRYITPTVFLYKRYLPIRRLFYMSQKFTVYRKDHSVSCKTETSNFG